MTAYLKEKNKNETIMEGLQKKYTVDPAALESVDTITIIIRRFARKAWCYMDLYRKEITGKLAEYAVRKY